MRRSNRSSPESKAIACRNSGITTLRTRMEACERTLQELRRESDRGCVLVGAAALGISLERLIRTSLSLGGGLLLEELDVEIKRTRAMDASFSNDAPLGSLGSRVAFAFATGLLDGNTYRQLDGVRRIRNEFAHSIEHATFGDIAVRQRIGMLLCQNNHTPDRRSTARSIFVRCVAFNVGLLEGMDTGMQRAYENRGKWQML